MKRDFLEGLGVPAEAIDKIMAENGKDIEGAKAKFADYDDIRKQLETANATIDKFKDYDEVKAEVEKYKAELRKSQEESAAKIAAMERSSKVNEFLADKKFVNQITREHISKQVADALADGKHEGKSVKDIFDEITKDKADILKDENAPQPPTTIAMGGGKPKGDADEDARIDAIMGLTKPKDKE
ncbi:MAG: phage scaffolding protein [Lachnospiraceae bacterium]|nr:phage scaffolding protein [Lachnospiraceae bacterium]MCM1232071.1 phage scaffolding protein [Ruminococcus flavefaciens]